jgi:hypothetical protein
MPEHKKSKKQGKTSHSASIDDNLARADERLRKKEKRRAQRLANHLAELGLDANGVPMITSHS